MEIWRDIEGYKGLYQVSNLGRIKSLKFYSNVHKKHYDREMILKEKTNRYGYKMVGLSKNGCRTNKLIHRLVAQAFIPNHLELREINHIDGDKSNNCVNNLEWCTRSYNVLHAYKLGLRKGKSTVGKKILQISNGKIIKVWDSISEIKSILHLDYSSIYQCCNNKRKSCNGFQWKYEEEAV